MLKDKLTELKAVAAGKIPPETLAVMQQAKEALANSDILNRTIKAGAKMPDFILADAGGRQVSLSELRRKGPVMISLYRGVW
jgi:hypothetical protein